MILERLRTDFQPRPLLPPRHEFRQSTGGPQSVPVPDLEWEVTYLKLRRHSPKTGRVGDDANDGNPESSSWVHYQWVHSQSPLHIKGPTYLIPYVSWLLKNISVNKYVYKQFIEDAQTMIRSETSVRHLFYLISRLGTPRTQEHPFFLLSFTTPLLYSTLLFSNFRPSPLPFVHSPPAHQSLSFKSVSPTPCCGTTFLP